MTTKKHNVLIEFVITNQCNKRCKYCDLDFSDNEQSEEDIEIFYKFVSKNQKYIENLTINFFWGEPLLQIKKVRKLIERLQKFSNIRYSLGTNGLLLNEESFSILSKNNVELYLSIDTETYTHIFLKKYLFSYPKIKINFILNPHTIRSSFPIYKQLYETWFRKFNIIPVYITINWDNKSLLLLRKFRAFVWLFDNVDNYFFSFFEEPRIDTEFIFDTDGFIYKDLHTHFWFLKQFCSTSGDVKKEINDITKIGRVRDMPSLTNLIGKDQQKKLFSKGEKIIKKEGLYKNLSLIHAVIKE